MASRLFELAREFLRPETAVDHSLPSLDGGYTPNDDLDKFTSLGSLSGVQDVLAIDHHRAVVTAGRALWLVDVLSASLRRLVELDGEATGMDRLGNEIVVAVVGQGLVAWNMDSEILREVAVSPRGPLANASAVAVVGSRIFFTCASADNAWPDWPRDLMEKGASGGLFEVGVDGEPTVALTGLAWPFGLCASPDGSALIYTEAWAHRLARYDLQTSKSTDLTDRLPGYPGRIRPTRQGTLLLALFAPRNHLVEFVLRRDGYRRRMMTEIAVDDWISPKYRPSRSVRQPMQLGGAVHLGEIKPWSPVFSYGLVAELTERGIPLSSYHSRAGGQRHGVTSACEVGDQLLIACQGSHELLLYGANRHGDKT